MSETDQKLLEHFRNPKNVGIIENANGYARGKNPINGYVTDMYIRVENEQIKDIKYKTFGCVATIASTSAFSEIVKGKTLEEIVDSGDPLGMLLDLIKMELGDIPEKNWHCPPTAIQTFLNAFSDYYSKNKDEKNVKLIEKILADIKCYFENKLSEY